MAPVFALMYPDDTRYAHVSAQEQMLEADKDGDSKLSREEMTEAVHDLYSSLDPDPHNLRSITHGPPHVWQDHDEF